MPHGFGEAWDFVNKITSGDDNWDVYQASALIKKTVDLYFVKLDEFLDKKKSKPKAIQNESKTNSKEYSKVKADKVFKDFLVDFVSKIEDVWVNEKLKSTAGLRNFKKEMLEFHDWQPTDNIKSFQAFVDKTERLFKILTKYVEDHEEPHKKSDWADYLGAHQFFLSQARELLPVTSDKKKNSNTSKVKRESVTKKKESNRTKKVIRPSANSNAKKVEDLSIELKFLKRYINLHNKEKKRSQIRLFISALQKAIRERKITKTSKFAKEISEMQTALITLHSSFKNDSEFLLVSVSENKRTKILHSLGKQIQMLSVKLIKSYITLQGKLITNKQAHRLHTRIVRAYNVGKVTKRDKYWKELESIMEQLAAFIEKNPNQGLLRIESRALNGLSGIVLGCPCDQDSLDGFDTIPERTIMNSMDIIKLNFKKLDFKGKWREFIGNPSKGFSAMILPNQRWVNLICRLIGQGI
ncbi:MAG: hypothetical protein GQ574_19800 [Crocinitomix sp.]|nr:hypothetical protein [Crocinitomix sp.]